VVMLLLNIEDIQQVLTAVKNSASQLGTTSINQLTAQIPAIQ
jgi:hypothetical protein